MNFAKKLIRVAWLLATLGSVGFAQDITLSYEISTVGEETHRLRVWMQGATGPHSVEAANFSVAYVGDCAELTQQEVRLHNTWTEYLEQSTTHDSRDWVAEGTRYSHRFLYGNANPGLPETAPLHLSGPDADPILVAELVFSGACSNQLRLETEAENPLNQIAGDGMRLLSFEVQRKATPEAMAFATVDGQWGDGKAEIMWTAVREKVGGFFFVERSASSVFDDVQLIGKVDATPGAGLHPYLFTDAEGGPMIRYYRLRYVGPAGEERISEDVRLQISNLAQEFDLQATPNPFRESLVMNWRSGSDEIATLRLLDLTGRLIASRQSTSGTTTFNLPDLAVGVYVVEIEVGEETQRTRVVKK